jgi:hypothetical protein
MPPRKKKIPVKDWYWEAEHDRIAADEDLKLIRSPDGWPSEGFDCVGLWFLMFNLMSRSPRRGYLLSPADNRKPMSSHELAVLTGRAEAVVSRLQAVILLRGLFSKTEDGIIYSRGLVKKEELRKIRSKSGKKGGLRSQSLLKQKFEQNTEQTLGIGIKEQTVSSAPESAEKSHAATPPHLMGVQGEGFAQAKSFAQAKVRAKTQAGEELDSMLGGLAQEAAFLQGKGTGATAVSEWFVLFGDLVNLGLTVEEIAAEVQRDDRERAEKPWELRKRMKSKGKESKQISDEEFMRRAGAGGG